PRRVAHGYLRADWAQYEKAPPCMRWRGLTRSRSARHRYLMLSVRAARSATKPDTRLKSRSPGSSCVRGAPRAVPGFGGERFLRLSRRAPQGVAGSNFKIFLPSTKYPQFSGSYPLVAPDSPQEVHRSGPAKSWA